MTNCESIAQRNVRDWSQRMLSLKYRTKQIPLIISSGLRQTLTKCKLHMYVSAYFIPNKRHV